MQNIQISNSTVNIHIHPAPKKRGRRLNDLTGQTFGRLTVLERAENQGEQTAWLCQCGCDLERKVIVQRGSLVRGRTTSCGCVRKEYGVEFGKASFKHGHSLTSNNTSPPYKSWKSMKDRCTNPNADNYSRYGGAGVTVCDRWLESFENFLEDLGERPLGTTLDRIDPYGNYEPSNTRWADAKTQSNNQRARAA